MVEQDPVAGKDSVRLAVVDRDPVAIELGDSIWRARIERRGLALRRLAYLAVQLGGRRLVETRPFFQTEYADRFQHAQRAQRIGVGRVFRFFERDGDVALCSEVVDFLRLGLLDDTDKAGGIRHVPVVQHQAALRVVRIAVQVIDALRIEKGSAALYAVDDIALIEQELGEVRTVLPGDPGNQCNLGCHWTIFY